MHGQYDYGNSQGDQDYLGGPTVEVWTHVAGGEGAGYAGQR